MQSIDIVGRDSWFHNLLYSVFVIGGIEELCKIVPDQLNPFRAPFDFLIPKPKMEKQEVVAIAEEESSE